MKPSEILVIMFLWLTKPWFWFYERFIMKDEDPLQPYVLILDGETIHRFTSAQKLKQFVLSLNDDEDGDEWDKR